MKAMGKLSRDRLNACDILADSLRNAITKSGLIVSLIKQEVGYLREQWEDMLLKHLKEKNIKEERIRRLENILAAMEGGDRDLRAVLINAHKKFQDLSLPPELGRRWIEMQLETKWSDFLKSNKKVTDVEKELVNKSIDELKKSLRFGMEPDMIAHYNGMPEGLKNELVRILYEERESFDAQALERLLDILANPSLNMQSKERSRKVLMQLKVLAETMSQLERNTNFLLHQVLNGDSAKRGMGE